MDYSVQQEFKRVWQALKCKANCGSTRISVVYITREALLTLISEDNVKVGTTYIITDIDGFYEVAVVGITTNSISSVASGLLYSPDYTVSGINLGQLDANTPQTLADGEKVIWADHYWINNSGGAVTPTILDNTTLDAPLTQIAKSSTDYLEIPVKCAISPSLVVTSIFNPYNNTSYSVSEITVTAIGDNLYKYAAFNNPLLNDSYLSYVFNTYGDAANNEYSTLSQNQAASGNDLSSNSGRFTGILITGTNNTFSGNQSSGNGGYDTLELRNTSRFTGNSISDASYGLAQMGFIELWDNCEMVGNTIIGDGAIWDLRTGENCSVNNNTIDVPNGAGSGNTYAVISDLDQMNYDEINGNTLTLVSAPTNQIHMLMIRQYGFSKCNNHTLSADGCHIQHVKQTRAELTGFTLSQPNKVIERIDMINSKLKNGTNISITDFTLKGDYDIDLTGFTTDIANETIENGKGWFTITHDFSTSPLTSGSSVLYNLMPTGARVTNIKTVGNATGGAGAELAFGIETDAPTLLPSAVLATVNAGQTYNSISTPATANRSLAITAAVDNVTGGSVTVYIEFIM